MRSKGWLWGGLIAGLLVAAAARQWRARVAQIERNRRVKVLVVGAGVVGSTYAARLARWGMDVTVLARGQRLQELTTQGLALRRALTRRWRWAEVRIVAAIAPEEEYDLVIVAVRHTQTQEALAAIKPLAETTPILLLQHNPVGPERPAAVLQERHVLMGFPATGGVRVGGEIIGLPFWLGPTIIGESDGAHTQRLHQACSILRRAGLTVQVERRIVSWLKTQAALEAVLAGCLYKNGGRMCRLMANRQEMRLYGEALREAQQLLEAQGIRSGPRPWMQPSLWSRAALRLASWLPWAGPLVEGRLVSASDEFRALYEHLLATASGLPAPALRALQPYFPAAK